MSVYRLRLQTRDNWPRDGFCAPAAYNRMHFCALYPLGQYFFWLSSAARFTMKVSAHALEALRLPWRVRCLGMTSSARRQQDQRLLAV
mgnify:CR=1 FL=1